MSVDPTPYAAIESASNPSFSADGRTLFHLRGAGLQQVWALDLHTGAETRLSDHDEKVALLRRAPDDDRLIYGIDAGGDERQQLWLYDGAARPLTDAPQTIHGFGAWTRDGARFSLSANDADEARMDILVQDVATGARTRLHLGRHEVSIGPWHKDGDRLIAIEERATGDQRPFVLGLDGAAHPIPRTRPTRYAALRWDGDALLGLTDALGTGFMALCRIEPETGAVAALFAPEGRDVEAWALAPMGGLLATVENDRGYGLLRVGPREGERPLVTGLESGVASDLAWSPDGTRLVFVWSAPERPAGLLLWQDGAAREVWEPALDLPTWPWQLVEWPSADGTIVPGWLAMPSSPRPAEALHAVIWVHGGPAAQARPVLRPDMQALLAQGYAVLLPNVRGSTGYGRAWMEIDDREHRLAAVHDLVAAHRFLAAQPGIDPERIAVMGQSYGGYMVNAAITEAPALWRCAISLYGIADFTTLLAQTGPWRRAHRAAEYGDPMHHRALFDRISPIRHIDRAHAPLLLLHGRRDPRVPYGESEQMDAALRARQRPVQFETFEYAGHGFVRPDDRSRLFRLVADWLGAHL